MQLLDVTYDDLPLLEADDRKVNPVLWQHVTRLEFDEAGLHDVPRERH